MKNLTKFWQTTDKYYIFPLSSTALCAIGITLTYLFFYGKLPGKLPLFYSLPWGSPQLIIKEQIFLIPTVLTLISLVNFLLSSQLHPAQFVLKRILNLGVIIINLIFLITALKILFIFF